ncbi:hypothetical protein NN561_014079 [Cricetulus griseus]
MFCTRSSLSLAQSKLTFTKNNRFQVLLQYADPVSAQHAKLSLDDQNIYNACCLLRIDFSKLTSLNVKYNNEKSRVRAHLDQGQVIALTCPLGQPDCAGPDHGCSLWCTRHKVRLSRVLFNKILFKKKGNALVQMADGSQAQLAMDHLNGHKLHGKSVHVRLSKHPSVQLPREGQEDQGLTRDYGSSPLHRFKKLGFKNFQNILLPSATLHLSNTPPSVSEDDLKNFFSSKFFKASSSSGRTERWP